MGLRDRYIAAMHARCVVAPPRDAQHATSAAPIATTRATSLQHGWRLRGVGPVPCATYDATTTQREPLQHATTVQRDAQDERRKARITWLGYANKADRLAEVLTLRDRDLYSRHLCVECRHAGPGWRCEKREAFLLEQLQRCPALQPAR